MIRFDLMDGDDVRMIDGGGGACFAEESFACDRVGGEIGPHHFHGDGPIQTFVHGFVNATHSTFPDQTHDAQPRDEGGQSSGVADRHIAG